MADRDRSLDRHVIVIMLRYIHTYIDTYQRWYIRTTRASFDRATRPTCARSRLVGVSFDRAQLDQDRYGASPRARSRPVFDFGSFSRPRPPWLNRDRRLRRPSRDRHHAQIYTYIHTCMHTDKKGELRPGNSTTSCSVKTGRPRPPSLIVFDQDCY